VWGRYVYIEHDEADCDGNKYFTIYAHLDAVSDRIPDSGTVRVERGEQIGWSGKSGTQEGIHLHFEVSTGALPRAGERVDPYDLYSTREAYPPGDNRECGENRLWTSDPPTLLVAE
jgi:murein DD-endopeptidase MepM/ murein hydrolase activator NlpD